MKKKIAIAAMSTIIGLGLLFFLVDSPHRIDLESDVGRFLFLPYLITPNRTILPVTRTTLNVRDTAEIPRIFFQALENSPLYFLLITPDRKIKNLFPGPGNEFSPSYYLKDYYLLKNSEPYFPKKGKYTLYIVATTDPCQKIMKLLNQYDKLTATKNRAEGAALFAELLAQIRYYQKQINWNQNLHKKPDWYSGTIRTDKLVFNYAWPISFQDVFVYQIDINYTGGEE